MRKSQESGFTLIELAIVVGGLLVASLFLPYIESDKNPNVQCAAAAATACVMNVGDGSVRPR